MRIVFDGEIFYLCRNTIFHHTMLITEIFVCFDCALCAEATVVIGLNLKDIEILPLNTNAYSNNL